MKSGFKDPTAIKKQAPKDTTETENKSLWNFKCPQYDERTSSFINAGTHYGMGHRQPVGHSGNAEQRAATMPMGKVNTMRVDEAG